LHERDAEPRAHVDLALARTTAAALVHVDLRGQEPAAVAVVGLDERPLALGLRGVERHARLGNERLVALLVALAVHDGLLVHARGRPRLLGGVTVLVVVGDLRLAVVAALGAAAVVVVVAATLAGL